MRTTTLLTLTGLGILIGVGVFVHQHRQKHKDTDYTPWTIPSPQNAQILLSEALRDMKLVGNDPALWSGHAFVSKRVTPLSPRVVQEILGILGE